MRTFGAVTRDLEALRDWLCEAGVTHVGMESTGVYWRPVYAVLEEHFELIVGNARHIRNVPSRAKGSYLKDKFHRLKARRGAMRAALAIAHKILVSAYHMLAKGLPYRDLGEAYLDQIGQTRTVANLKRRLERLGYRVILELLEPKDQPT